MHPRVQVVEDRRPLVLLHEVRVEDHGRAVQGGREVEPEPEQVARQVPDVAIEDVGRGQRDRDRQREHELDRGHQRDEEQPRAEPVAVEQDREPHQRDEPEGEVDDAGAHRRHRQDELREVDLLDQPLLRRDRRDAVLDGRLEPLPGQDRREHEQAVVLDVAVEDQRHQDGVDEHLDERVDHPPDVAQQRVRTALLDVGTDHVEDEAPPGQHLADAVGDEAERSRADRRRAERGRRLGSGGHAPEGSTQGRPDPSSERPPSVHGVPLRAAPSAPHNPSP